MSSRRTRRIKQQVTTYTARQVPQSQRTTEEQRLRRKRRALLAKAREADQRGDDFVAQMHRREADKVRGAQEKAQGRAQEATNEIATAKCDWDFRWVRQAGGVMVYQRVAV